MQVGQHNQIFMKLEDSHSFIMPSDRVKKTLIFHKLNREISRTKGMDGSKEKPSENETIWYTNGSKTTKITGYRYGVALQKAKEIILL